MPQTFDRGGGAKKPLDIAAETKNRGTFFFKQIWFANHWK